MIERTAKSNTDDYPEIDWPVSETEADWDLLRSERKDGRIRFLWQTERGPAWTPWVEMAS